MKKLKPIGTIVRIKGDKSLLMITGYLKNNKNQPEVVYDYCSSYYPIGLEEEKIILFNDEDIDVVMFIGYQDNTGIDFRKKLLEKYEESKKGQ